MFKKKGLIGLGIFAAALWAVVMTSYAAQSKRDQLEKTLRTYDDCGCQCSSSGTSGGE